ncbi:hypothetical protein PoB_004890000 [Plakobranchus ocellatus]|uniref:Uncharacterized protein n=1 Tax=Plakobranchus ocellatus TaxID=259542 RepID=A0AAV4BTD7_9GAST|nr:hypothetical protein PoB_004890000 [Plakobranchus ocellatus]
MVQRWTDTSSSSSTSSTSSSTITTTNNNNNQSAVIKSPHRHFKDQAWLSLLSCPQSQSQHDLNLARVGLVISERIITGVRPISRHAAWPASSSPEDYQQTSSDRLVYSPVPVVQLIYTNNTAVVDYWINLDVTGLTPRHLHNKVITDFQTLRQGHGNRWRGLNHQKKSPYRSKVDSLSTVPPQIYVRTGNTKIIMPLMNITSEFAFNNNSKNEVSISL